MQIRDVPDDLHRRLQAWAAMEGVSLSRLALVELRRSLERPTRRELLARVAAREAAGTDLDSAEGRTARARRVVIVLDASAAVE